MKALEGRIEALEKAKNNPIPIYALTFENGTEARLDALDAHLYLARMKAGMVPKIVSGERISGTMPKAGTVWLDLQNEISSITLSRKGR